VAEGGPVDRRPDDLPVRGPGFVVQSPVQLALGGVLAFVGGVALLILSYQ
jgi:hypothetical protein